MVFPSCLKIHVVKKEITKRNKHIYQSNMYICFFKATFCIGELQIKKNTRYYIYIYIMIKRIQKNRKKPTV